MKDNPLLKAKNSFAANVSYAIVIHHKFYIEPKPKHTEKNALKRWSANITWQQIYCHKSSEGQKRVFQQGCSRNCRASSKICGPQLHTFTMGVSFSAMIPIYVVLLCDWFRLISLPINKYWISFTAIRLICNSPDKDPWAGDRYPVSWTCFALGNHFLAWLIPAHFCDLRNAAS